MNNFKFLCSRMVAYCRDILLSPFYWLHSRMLFNTDVFDRHHGIVIAEYGPKDSLDPLFVPKTKEALDLLKKIDERRFRRVQKEIKAIIKSSNRRKAAYHGPLKVCLVDFDAFRFCENPNDIDKVKLYACVLLHEATHGRLERIGIPTSRRSKNKREKICVEEEIRLSRRFQDGRHQQWEGILRNKYLKILGI